MMKLSAFAGLKRNSKSGLRDAAFIYLHDPITIAHVI